MAAEMRQAVDWARDSSPPPLLPTEQYAYRCFHLGFTTSESDTA